MKKTAFITRDLHPESIFLHRLSAAGWQVAGESLLSFSPLNFGQLPVVDWVFFYSKKGIQYFFQQEKINANLRYAVMGQASGAALQQQGINPNFVGTGEPESTAQAFQALAKGQRILFPCATNSRHSIRDLLGDNIEAYEVIVYHNEKRKDIAIRTEQVLVFTSPMNVEAYFDLHDLASGQQLLAIGETTASKLRALGFDDIKVANQADEMALAEAVGDLSGI